MKETRFKQTEIGLIPEDWEVTTIDNVSHFLKKIVYPDLTPKVLYKEYSMPSFDLNMKPAVIKGEDMSSSRILMIGDNVLLINKLNVRKKRIWYVETPASNSVCSGEFIPISSDIEILKFIKYYLQQESVVNEWVENSTGTSNSQKRVNPSFIKKYIIAFPQSSERERIVRTLTTTDKFIDTINSLIEKKKLIKQGVMQELLTGKKRLPGFTGEWIERRLGDIGEIIKESMNPQLYRTHSFSEYSMPAYDLNKQPEIKYGEEMFSNRTKIYGTVLLYNKLNVRQRRIWYIENCKHNSICSMEFLPYKVYRDHLKFFYYMLSIDTVVNYFVGISKGTSNSQKRISPNDFLDFKVKYPRELQEQKAIATALSSMDKEIELLEGKKAKYEQIKQGMMQLLLTGKIRLIS